MYEREHPSRRSDYNQLKFFPRVKKAVLRHLKARDSSGLALKNLSEREETFLDAIDEIPQEDTSAIHRAQARAMPDEQEAEMSLPFIGYTYKAFNAFQGN